MKIVSERLGRNNAKWVTIECARDDCNKTREDRLKKLQQSSVSYCSRECYIKSMDNAKPLPDVECIGCGVHIKGSDRHYSNRSTASKRCEECRDELGIMKMKRSQWRKNKFMRKFNNMEWKQCI